MPKQAVIVDVDDTISDTQRHMLDQIERQFKTRYNWDDLTLASREGREKIYDEHVRAILSQPEVMAATRPLPQALEAIKRLYDWGFEVHIASSRQEPLHEVTAVWLKQHGFADYIDRIHPRPGHTKGKLFKRQVANTIRAAALFDDTLDVVLELADAGVEGYLIDKPWNQTASRLPNNVTRTSDFPAAVTLFLKRTRASL